MQEFIVRQSGTHGIRRSADAGAHVSGRINHLADTGLNALQESLEHFQTGNSKGVFQNIDEIPDLRHDRPDDTCDGLADPVEHITLLCRLVHTNQPVADGCRDRKNPVTQRSKTAEQRADHIEYRREPLLD